MKQDELRIPARTGKSYIRRKSMQVDMCQLEELDDIDGINIKQLIAIINSRIVDIDKKENMISHEHFMCLKKISNDIQKSKLDTIFKFNIIPSLEDDFYVDLDYDNWEKIYKVLGEGFIEKHFLSKEKKYVYKVKSIFDYSKLFL